MSQTRTIEVVGALIRDDAGRLLLVRKQGAELFMLPGGKREPGEDDLTALARELDEELGCRLTYGDMFGVFEAAAANEPDTYVRSHAFAVTVEGDLTARAEIAELLWIDPQAPPAACVAPLLVQQILPRLAAGA